MRSAVAALALYVAGRLDQIASPYLVCIGLPCRGGCSPRATKHALMPEELVPYTWLAGPDRASVERGSI